MNFFKNYLLRCNGFLNKQVGMEQKEKKEEDCNKTNINICVKKISKKIQIIIIKR